MRRIDYIVIHQSASPLWATRDQIREWHLSRRIPFDDIGYHWVIEASGLYLPGRPEKVMGAHAKGCNRHSIGICVVGDNSEASTAWRFPQIESLQSLVRIKLAQYPGAEVVGHCDVGSTKTECPGVDIRALLGGT